MADKMSREAVGAHVAQIVAKNLPPGFIDQCVEEALRTTISNFKVSDYEVSGLLKEVIQAKAKWLIATKYQAQVMARAEEIAQKAFASSR